MLRFKCGVRIQFEKITNSNILLFPEGLVELNESAFAVLSRLPNRRETIYQDLCDSYKTPQLDGFDEFILHAQHSKWIEIIGK